jgi:hypothetical protein
MSLGCSASVRAWVDKWWATCTAPLEGLETNTRVSGEATGSKAWVCNAVAGRASVCAKCMAVYVDGRFV